MATTPKWLMTIKNGVESKQTINANSKQMQNTNVEKGNF
jgi:hypothetical protein